MVLGVVVEVGGGMVGLRGNGIWGRRVGLRWREGFFFFLVMRA